MAPNPPTDQNDILAALKDIVENISPERLQQIIAAARAEGPQGQTFFARETADIKDKVEAIWDTLASTNTQAIHHLEHHLQSRISAREGQEAADAKDAKAEPAPVPVAEHEYTPPEHTYA